MRRTTDMEQCWQVMLIRIAVATLFHPRLQRDYKARLEILVLYTTKIHKEEIMLCNKQNRMRRSDNKQQ
jgi:hypothetical protein